MMLTDDYKMLADHGREVERCALRYRQRRDMPRAFGEFMAGLADWDWFMNPISFRDDGPTGPPAPDAALARLGDYFHLVQRAASEPVGWVIAEEFGKLGGRYHCHALVAGVADQYRKFWWAEAFRRFGRTRIEPFDRERAATFYAAKYLNKQLGGLHFGGTLAGVVLSDCEIPSSASGKQTVMHSAELPKEFYRLGLGRWHR
jgi:hypothetical protein